MSINNIQSLRFDQQFAETYPITSGATCDSFARMHSGTTCVHIWSEATSDPCVAGCLAGREAIATLSLDIAQLVAKNPGMTFHDSFDDLDYLKYCIFEH